MQHCRKKPVRSRKGCRLWSEAASGCGAVGVLREGCWFIMYMAGRVTVLLVLVSEWSIQLLDAA